MFRHGRDLTKFLQVQVAECGLMSVAAAAHVLGVELSASQVRQWFPSSVRGTSIAEMSSIATSLGLIPTAVYGDTEDLRTIELPAVLHWNDKHFCVLLRRSRGGFIVFDPAKGTLKLSAADVKLGFSGGILLVKRDYSAARKSRSYPATLLQAFLRAARGPVLALIGFSFVLQLAGLAVPLLSQAAINLGAVRGGVQAVSTVATSMLIVYVLTFVVELWRSRLNLSIASQLSESASRSLFRHMLHLPVEWFERRKFSDSVSRFESIEPIRHAISSGLTTLVVDGTLGFVVSIGLMLVSPLLGLIVLASVFATAVVKLAFSFSVSTHSALAAQSRIQEQAKRWETFRSVSTLKLAHAEQAQERAWIDLVQTQLLHTERHQAVTSLQQTTSGLVSNVGGVAVLVTGVYLVMGSALSIGGLFAFVMYRRYLSDKVGAAADQLGTLWTLRYHLERLSEVMDATPEARWNDLRETGDCLENGALEISQASFRHGSSQPYILQHLDFRAAAGETIVIHGASGSGKTTLIKLMTGLISPTSGTISLDGISYAVLSPRQLRSTLAAVLQGDDLFSGSIFDNVVMFSDEPDMELAIDSLKRAELWSEVKSLPMGLHTHVGDGGRLVSAGQKQRILLARAFYRKPKILFLDEATANLDTKTEHKIYLNLKAMSCTKIIVAHSRIASQFADRLLTLDERGLREFGRAVDISLGPATVGAAS